jgi:hypothetical protein
MKANSAAAGVRPLGADESFEYRHRRRQRRHCQGRICGSIVSAVMAHTLGKSIGEIGTYRPRAPLKPITVGALADLDAGAEPSGSSA